VNIGDFRTEKGENFLSLIKQLDKVDGIERFRISSIEPNLLTDEIIEFVSASNKFVPHFHIPLQSGSDKILKLMRRRYLRDLYQNRVMKIKSLMPHCSIGVDVIVGFPGESDQDFSDSYQFITDLDVSYLHVFTYSEREHTEAFSMNDIIPVSERKRRNKMLRILSQKKLQHFYRQHLGQFHKVMFETENKNGMLHGFTENYIKVKTFYDPSLVRQVEEVELNYIDDDQEVICKVKNLEPA
ncbi:MAG: radical SAM protein, partial [Bacteroidota bacterium]